MFTKIKNGYVTVAQKLSAAFVAPTEKQARVVLLLLGVGLLGVGLSGAAHAQNLGGISYENDRINDAIGVVMQYIEGSFGALIMTAAGIGAIMSAAFGNYKVAMSLLVVAVGSFILRNFITAFFPDLQGTL